MPRRPPFPTPQAEINALLEEVRSIFDRSEWDYYIPDGVQALQRVLELDPHCAEAHFLWGRLLQDSGQPAESEFLEHYARALALRPQYGEVYLQRALHLESSATSLDDYPAIVALCREAVRCSPELVEAWGYLLGYLPKTERDETRELMLFFNPTSVEAHWLAALHATPELGLSYLNRALELDPNQPETYRRRAHLLESLGQDEAALRDFYHYKTLIPKADISYSVALILARLGQFEEARAACRSVQPLEFRAWIEAQVWALQGDLAKAVGCYQLYFKQLNKNERLCFSAPFREIAQLYLQHGQARPALEAIETALGYACTDYERTVCTNLKTQIEQALAETR